VKLSTERILTTHGGSLTRPDDLLEMITAKEAGRPYDEKAFAERVRREVSEVVRRQHDVGVDVVSDGEEGKPGFFTYIDERLSGFEYQNVESQGPSRPRFADMADFPEYANMAPPPLARPVCVGPIKYTGQTLLQTDIDNLQARFWPSERAGHSLHVVRLPHLPRPGSPSRRAMNPMGSLPRSRRCKSCI
jgi:5-methyltetrahydropteroyltriglutamate--homocysteine methyltransferase